jgi:hypothetical protein
VQTASDQIMSQYPQIIDPLIQRWLGEKINYANV